MGKPTGLAEEQQRALDRLSRVPALEGFYLAGGTAVAHRLGHRTSLGLDLFSGASGVDLEAIRSAVNAAIPDVKVMSQSDATLRLRVGRTPVDIVH